MSLPVGALSSDVFIQRVPSDSLDIVLVFSERIHAFTWLSALRSLMLRTADHSPVPAFQILAVLSVEPAIKNSLSGDQARSYTCFVVTLRTSADGR